MPAAYDVTPARITRATRRGRADPPAP